MARRIVAAAAVAATWMAPAVSHAATVTKTGGTIDNRLVTYTYAGAGFEVNRVTVTFVPDPDFLGTDHRMRFADASAPITSVGSGCTAPTGTGTADSPSVTECTLARSLLTSGHAIVVNGGESNDELASTVTQHPVALNGNAGNDVLTGGAGGESLDGGTGGDTIHAGGGDDIVRTGTEHDPMVNGGPGTDTIAYDEAARTTGVTVNIGDAFGDGGSAEVSEEALEFENVVGSPYDDHLTGSAGPNTLEGLAGADQLYGGDGDDRLVPGADTDAQVEGGSGRDVVSFNDGRASGITLTLFSGGASQFNTDTDDIRPDVEDFEGTLHADTITGDDDAGRTLVGLNGVDTLTGGSQADTLVGGQGADTLNGGGGTDTASYRDGRGSGVTLDLSTATIPDGDTGVAAFERIEGSDRNDVLTGDGNADRLAGAGGDDVITGGGGADVLDGGDGADTASYAERDTPVTVSLAGGTGEDTLTAFERLLGGGGGDVLTGDAAANRLDGGPGDDRLVGGGSADQLIGGEGGADVASYEERAAGVTVALAAGAKPDNDTFTGIEGLAGSTGDDVLTGTDGADVLVGNAGADTLTGLGGADDLRGGAPAGGSDGAADRAAYAERAEAVEVDLAAGTSSDGDTLADVQSVTGGSGDDTLRGDGGANALDGGAGADLLVGRGGSDALDGGSGADTASYDDGRGTGVSVDLAAGTNTDADTFTGLERWAGTAFADTLTGGDAAETLVAGGGGDTITGGGGADTLSAGEGDDAVDAEDGVADTVDCGSGTDPARLDDVDLAAGCEPAGGGVEPEPTPTPEPGQVVVTDADGDGIPAARDCDDANADIRPGAPEVPGNAVDEDCSGAADPFPTVAVTFTSAYKAFKAYTRFSKLAVEGVPGGATLTVGCKQRRDRKIKKAAKRSCPFKSRKVSARSAGTVDLVKAFKKRKLRKGTVVTVDVAAPQAIGRRWTFKVKGTSPRRTVVCVPPGGSPRAC